MLTRLVPSPMRAVRVTHVPAPRRASSRASRALLALATLLALPAARPLRAQPAVTSADLDGLRLRSIGPASMSGRVVDMDVVESDPYTMYVAGATGGLWRTTDNGVTWSSIFDAPVHSIGDVAVFQPNPQILWVGTGERANRQSVSWGDGVYKSTDGGKTWSNTGLRTSMHIGRIQLHPSNPDIAFVAAQGSVWGAGGERGLYRTTDGGRSWQRVLHVDDETGATDVVMDPTNPSVLYAATYQRRRSAFGFDGGGPGSALWKSTDAGATWTKLTGNGLPTGEYGRIGIAVYRKNPRIVVVSIEQGQRYNASTAYTMRKAGLYRSDDAGGSWRFLSDWNPRPMYASQPTIDPNDDQRVYMLNAYSFSNDGGKTFTAPRTTTHGDDRFVWVNPRDSRHVVKLDDGGIGISYDRGVKFLYVTSLPLSQFYRVAVDNAVPFNVYGGLQDNGCWKGPSASWNTTGVLNEHWSRLCGGDGFWVVPNPKNARTVYSASQFLGLQKNDTLTWQVQDIRPGDPEGHIAGRRNWETWGKPGATQVLGNQMHPANWDAPFVVSVHDTNTIYAGAQHLFRSRDGGRTWTDLGDMTTGVDRSTLPLMGRQPSEHTLSIDDGVPFFPGATALAESPRVPGLLYVGTDDGRLRVSRNAGATWTDLQKNLPGLPAGSWFAGVEPSRHADGTVYVVVDNHRSNDFANYVYKSTDFGRSFTRIDAGLPANRVARTIRQDPRNPALLYLATEFGVFLSPDDGGQWLPLRANLPLMPFNDLLVHPRDNALVLASHARGLWVLDQVNALQELTPAVAASAAHLFTLQPALQVRTTNLRPHTGDMLFRGENPAVGALIDYWVRDAGTPVTLTVHDSTGRLVQTLRAATRRGINRVVWNLREADLPIRSGGGEDDEEGPRATSPGPLVMPGRYTVRLEAAGVRREQRVVVRDDPRLTVPRAERAAWTAFHREVAALITRFVPTATRLREATGTDEATRDRRRQAQELSARLSGLYGEVARWTGVPTADQRSQLRAYTRLAADLERAAR
ncbi:MAG: hypothetical protein LCH84_00895 [Gemmatimonadetes bacterium]|nr:hypothetical protein [Gemmatimonadota bacterium]